MEGWFVIYDLLVDGYMIARVYDGEKECIDDRGFIYLNLQGGKWSDDKTSCTVFLDPNEIRNLIHKREVKCVTYSSLVVEGKKISTDDDAKPATNVVNLSSYRNRKMGN